MQQSDDIIDIIKEELFRYGVSLNNLDNESKKNNFYPSGSKFLGLNSNSKGKYNEYFVGSPKKEKNSAFELQKTPKKNAPKSPFASKNKLERKSAKKKKIGAISSENVSDCVFGCELDVMELCSVSLQDDTLVSVPKFVVDASNLIRKNLNMEGIFRKAGSAQRQNDIKNLLKSGLCLPATVHPIDVACLLKQFLRQLPTPLLSNHVYLLMTRCLNIPKSSQLEALILCTLLLPKRNQDLLAYVLELFSFVAATSNLNLMDSHNLAIVLAPNLMPPLKTGAKNSLFNEDKLLSSTIDIIQLLIEGANVMCRYSENFMVALENRDKSQSMENLTQPQSSGQTKKKRRSASIHKWMNGLRRVVHGGSLAPETPVASSPLRTVSTPPVMDNGLCDEISMNPDIECRNNEKTYKRKSEGIESLHCSEEKMFSLPALESSRPKKKPKIEPNVARTDFASFLDLSHIDEQLVEDASSERRTSDIGRRYSFRERKEIIFSSDRSSERRKSCVSILEKKSSRVQSCNSLRATPKSNSPHSSSVHATTKRVKSFNLPRTSSSYRRMQMFNENSHHDIPIGSDAINIEPRGVPDGAETNIRKSPLFKADSGSLRALEDEFVESRENKENSFSNSNDLNSCYNVELSNGTLILSETLEKLENKTKDLNTMPDENLRRRLSKELRIRGRRSDEFRVFRSPSERRIGTIRRRSKELEQQLAKSQQQEQQQKCDIHPKTQTPKLKGMLMQSPQAALKRGKPNSLKSGLPLVVKPEFAEASESLNKKTTPSNAIYVQKRRSSRFSPISTNSSSSSLRESPDVLNNSYSGPLTRRRSGLLNEACNTPLTEEMSLPKEFTTNISPQKNSQESELEWISAKKYMKNISHQDSDPQFSLEALGNRPSITALKEQKKVTSNLQLFSQLQDRCGGPSPSRRSSRLKSVNNTHIPVRYTKSENVNQNRALGGSPLSYLEHHRIPRSKLHVSPQVISPLKERNSSELIMATPKIMSKERRTPKVKRLESFNMPSGLTPLPPRPFKPPHLSTPTMGSCSFETPPRIPPRHTLLSSSKKQSPQIKNYR